MQVVCGPIVRRTTTNSSAIWVELDADCMVQVTAVPVVGPLPAGRPRGWKPPAAHSAALYTVTVGDRNYVLLPIEGLEPGWVYRYSLAGIQTDHKREPWHRDAAQRRGRWAGALLPIDIDRSSMNGKGPMFRTFPAAGTSDTRVVFGSCRKTDGGMSGPAAKGTDVLSLYAPYLSKLDRLNDWPNLLLLLGDQIYADDVDQAIAKARWNVKTRHWLSPLDAPESVMKRDRSKFPVYAGSKLFHSSEFEEFALEYVSSWTPANVAKVLANLPTFMIFDDHDITDDWNITSSWWDQMMDSEWWKDAVTDGLIAYWMYQGWGNPLPRDGASDPRLTILAKASAFGGDAIDDLRVWFRSHLKPGSADYYYRIDTTPPVLVMDTRHDRTFAKRTGKEYRNENDEIISENQWSWLKSNIDRNGPVILGMGVPFLQMLCADWMMLRLARNPVFNDEDGAEIFVRENDIEQWSAFPASFLRMAQLMVGRGPFAILSGDVHYSYGMFGRYSLPGKHCGAHNPLVLHAVSSPMRNQWPADHGNEPEMCFSIGVVSGGDTVPELIDQANAQAKYLCKPAKTDISWLRPFFPDASDIFPDEKVAGKKVKWTRFNNLGVLTIGKDLKSARVQWLASPSGSSLTELALLDPGPSTFVR